MLSWRVATVLYIGSLRAVSEITACASCCNFEAGWFSLRFDPVSALLVLRAFRRLSWNQRALVLVVQKQMGAGRSHVVAVVTHKKNTHRELVV